MKLLTNTGIDAKSWDYFILQHPEANLLQGWAWGDFQESLNNKIWRFRVIDNDLIVTQLLMIKLKLGLGQNLFYAPRDLLINKSAPAHSQHLAMKMLVDHIKDLAPKERAILLRIDPPISPNDTTSLSVYRSLGFIPSLKSIQPQENLMLDISVKETNLLAQMKPKTRYNIRLSLKKEVRTVMSQNLDDIKIFNALNRETTQRGGFKPYADSYYRRQLEALGRSDMMKLLIAYLGATPLAAILVTFFGSKVTYLHGASSHLHKEAMASYAVHWAAIQLGQKCGCLAYDLGGINYQNAHSAWTGITRFKEGFGGKVIKYIGALELPLNPWWHRLYRALNQIRG